MLTGNVTNKKDGKSVSNRSCIVSALTPNVKPCKHAPSIPIYVEGKILCIVYESCWHVYILPLVIYQFTKSVDVYKCHRSKVYRLLYACYIVSPHDENADFLKLSLYRRILRPKYYP